MAYAPCAKAPFQAKNQTNSYQHTQKNKRMDIVSVGTMSRCSKRRSHCSDSENNTFNERFENGGRTMIVYILSSLLMRLSVTVVVHHSSSVAWRVWQLGLQLDEMPRFTSTNNANGTVKSSTNITGIMSKQSTRFPMKGIAATEGRVPAGAGEGEAGERAERGAEHLHAVSRRRQGERS